MSQHTEMTMKATATTYCRLGMSATVVGIFPVILLWLRFTSLKVRRHFQVILSELKQTTAHLSFFKFPMAGRMGPTKELYEKSMTCSEKRLQTFQGISSENPLWDTSISLEAQSKVNAT